jgi:hypothetical protein
MKTTAKMDIVNYLLGLFATLVLLVSWPRGKKGGPQKWTKITAKDMADPAYLDRLAQGNIGVIMGPASGGIGSFDWDDDPLAEEFLALNPELRETLRTKGARGCNIWFYPDGQVPASCKLMRDGRSIGEWRWEGCQTIIWGQHPSGVEYQFLNAVPAIRYPFEKIQFPSGVTAKFIHPSGDPIVIPEEQNTEELIDRPQSVALCASLCPSVLSEGNGVLDEQTLETLLAGTIPHQRHGNHELLFALARRVKALEMGQPGPLGEAELQAIFSVWHDRANGYLRSDQTWDEYFFEFTEALGDVQKPGGNALVDVAWQAISTTSAPLPPEAELVKDGRLKKLVALCHLLQMLAGDEPFYLACRTVQRLFNLKTHEQAAVW